VTDVKIPESHPDHNFFVLSDVVDTLLGPLREKAADLGLSIDCEIEPETPDQLIGDATLLCRTMGILVEAALNFPPAADNAISLHICEADLDEDGVLLCISVAGQGPGMGEELTSVLLGEHQPHPEDSTQAQALFIARQLIVEMSGEIWVDGAPGNGKIFQFTARYPLHTPQSPAVATPPHSLHILLVDDVEINQELARVIMEKQGHRVTIAGNGAEAVEVYRVDNRFDMIFMDIQMPVMDGFQATLAIRELERKRGGHVPIIAMTAYSSSQDRQECLNGGMDSYIAKPVKPETIIAEINRYATALHQTATSEPRALPVEAAHDDNVPIFDRSALLERLCGNDELLPRFIALFITGAETGIEAIRNALTTGNSEEVYNQAHTLKGSAANIGAGRILALAVTLDERAKQQNISSMPALLAELEAEFELFKKEVGSSHRLLR
jgi:CheY-like chemotaxis protein/HPt (histidine-containing phosphotransfer) domain-containing protein